MAITGKNLNSITRLAVRKGTGEIAKQTPTREARRNSKMRALTGDEINQLIKAGFRVNDKITGLYVHAP